MSGERRILDSSGRLSPADSDAVRNIFPGMKQHAPYVVMWRAGSSSLIQSICADYWLRDDSGWQYPMKELLVRYSLPTFGRLTQAVKKSCYCAVVLACGDIVTFDTRSGFDSAFRHVDSSCRTVCWGCAQAEVLAKKFEDRDGQTIGVLSQPSRQAPQLADSTTDHIVDCDLSASLESALRMRNPAKTGQYAQVEMMHLPIWLIRKLADPDPAVVQAAKLILASPLMMRNHHRSFRNQTYSQIQQIERHERGEEQ